MYVVLIPQWEGLCRLVLNGPHGPSLRGIGRMDFIQGKCLDGKRAIRKGGSFPIQNGLFLLVLLTRNRGRLEWKERMIFHLIPHIIHPLRIRLGGTTPICHSILCRGKLPLVLVCHGPCKIRATSIAQHVPPMAVNMVPLLTCGPLFFARHSSLLSPALGGHPLASVAFFTNNIEIRMVQCTFKG